VGLTLGQAVVHACWVGDAAGHQLSQGLS